MTATRLPDEAYVDARSEECSVEPSAATAGQGLRVVMYHGEEYLVVGMYLARAPHGRELRCVLVPARQASAAPRSR